MSISTPQRVSFQQQWDQWHAEHEKRRAAPHGFLAITGLHWLTGTPQRLPGLPGEWRTGPDGVIVTGAAELGADPLTLQPDITVSHGEVEIEVARRGGYDVVRPRDPASPVLAAYRGTPAYPADEKWQVQGRFVPFDEPRPTTVGSVAEGIEHIYEAPGTIEFTLDGAEHRLTAFNGHTPGSLSVLFTDATSGRTTYAANRSLTVAAPGPDGAVTLDFNRATNLPCAYTEFATCPLPPAQNRLPVAVQAGEQIPR